MTWKTVCQKLGTPFMIMSVPIGIAVGGIFLGANSDPPYSKRNVMYVGFVGELALLAIKCLSLPFIVLCIVRGVASISATLTKTLGIKYALFIIATKFVCVILGMVLALALAPTNPQPIENTVDGIVNTDLYEDWFRLMFPSHVISMFYRSERTYYSNTNWGVVLRTFNRGTNYVGLVFISIASGVILRILANTAEDMLEVIRSMVRVFIVIFSWVVSVLPFCMIFDVASQIMAIDLSKIDKNFYIMYLTAVSIGLFCLLIIVFPLMYFVLVRKNPFRLMINLGKAMAIGFAASSSISAMNQSVKSMEKNNNIDRRFTRPLIPIGHTIHLAGKTFHGVIIAIFTANSSNVYLSGVDYATILFLGFFASFAVGPLPTKYKLSSMMLLSGIGMQTADVSAILMLDWIVGRLTTVVDIAGDCVGVAIMAHLHRNIEDATEDS